MYGTLDKASTRYRVTVTLDDGNAFSFGVEHLSEVLTAAMELAPGVPYVRMYYITSVNAPLLLAGTEADLAAHVPMLFGPGMVSEFRMISVDDDENPN